MSRILTARDFIDHVGSALTPRGQHRVLTLVSIDANQSPGWEAMPRQPFLLILRGPPGDVLPEGQYDVAFGDGPDLQLYIAPIHTAARDRQDYQVAFN
jgi:hypothetical protein